MVDIRKLTRSRNGKYIANLRFTVFISDLSQTGHFDRFSFSNFLTINGIPELFCLCNRCRRKKKNIINVEIKLNLKRIEVN